MTNMRIWEYEGQTERHGDDMKWWYEWYNYEMMIMWGS